jgi:hypothetical protein
LLAVVVVAFGHRVQERLQSTVAVDVVVPTIVIMLLLDNQILVVAGVDLATRVVNQVAREL